MIPTQSFKKTKPIIFLAFLLPSMFWSYQFINGSLGVNPIEKLMDNMGEMALRLIVLTLFISSLSEFKRRNTLMYNGYEEEVSYLYEGMDLRKYY